MGYVWTKYLKLRFLGLVPLFSQLIRWLGTAALKALSALERLAKLKEHGLCFRCFGRHWANRCRCSKRCGVNGFARLHNELLHRTMEENKSLSVPSSEEPLI